MAPAFLGRAREPRCGSSLLVGGPGAKKRCGSSLLRRARSQRVWLQTSEFAGQGAKGVAPASLRRRAREPRGRCLKPSVGGLRGQGVELQGYLITCLSISDQYAGHYIHVEWVEGDHGGGGSVAFRTIPLTTFVSQPRCAPNLQSSTPEPNFLEISSLSWWNSSLPGWNTSR